MKYYLERVIPVLQTLDEKEWGALINRIKPFIKEMPSTETLSGTLVLTDSVEGVNLAKKAGLPCLGLETEDGEHLPCPYVVTDVSAVTENYLERIYRRFHCIPWEILESRHCILREGSPEDVEGILGIYEDIEEFSLTKPFSTPEEGRIYMENYREMVYRLYEYGLWVMEEKKSGELIGVAGLENQIFGEEEFLALGYVIGKKWRRQGHGEKICREILVYAQEELGISKLHSFVEPENTASIRLLEKLGFHREKSVVQKEGQNGGSESTLWQYLWERSFV